MVFFRKQRRNSSSTLKRRIQKNARKKRSRAAALMQVQEERVLLAAYSLSETDGDTVVDEALVNTVFDTITVTMDEAPTSTFTIDVVASDTTELNVVPPTIAITPTNWFIPKQISVLPVDDVFVDGDILSEITFTANAAGVANFTGDEVQSVMATTLDNDDAGYTVSETTASVDESGTTDSFTVVLDAGPVTPVVFTVTSSDPGEATATSPLTFDSMNWDTPQTVTVTGVDDPTLDGDQISTLTVAIDDANSDDFFDPLGDSTVTVTTTDDDVAGFTVTESDGSTSVMESGTTDTFDVVLDVQPLSDVVFTVTSADTSEATVSTSALTFTNANWDMAQTVTVTGIDDDLVDGDLVTVLTIAVDDGASNDGFDPLPDATVNVTTLDDDTAGFIITETDGSTEVDESGTADTLTVALTGAPVTDVVLDVSSGDTSEGAVSPATLTFNSSNWDSPQTVTVTGFDDVLIDGDQA